MKLNANIAVSDTGFLFDPNTGDSYNINKTGQLILTLLKENKSENEILEKVLNDYDVDKQVLQRYLDDFVRMLQQFNLLDREEE